MIFLVLPDFAEEDRLLAEAIDGSQAAVMQIYEIYHTPIYQYLRMRVADQMLAEDLASEVFVKLINALRGKRPPRDSLRGWLFQVARNVLHDHYGKATRMPDTTLEEWLPAPDDEQPEPQFFSRVDLEVVRRGISQLNPEQQEVIVLRFGQMLDVQSTADIMGKSVSAVKVLQFRALEKLRAAIGRLNAGQEARK
jgi:RNA polymerase sigma-70 factor (ECF subfamily)